MGRRSGRGSTVPACIIPLSIDSEKWLLLIDSNQCKRVPRHLVFLEEHWKAVTYRKRSMQLAWLECELGLHDEWLYALRLALTII